MKALRRQSKTACDVKVQEVERPEPGAGQVRIKLDYCGICGSDLHAYKNDPGYESVLAEVTFGHELAGVIDAVGEGVTNWSVGQAASIVAVQGCLEADCPMCSTGVPQLCPDRRVQGLHLDGGMAEYMVADEKYLLAIPEGLDAKAAALTEPLSVGVHCVKHCSDIKKDDLVVVTGPGIIGMLSALVAREQGATVVVSGTAADDQVRLPAARRIGFETLIVGPDCAPLHEQVIEKYGRQADALIEASGASIVLSDAWRVVRQCGTVSVVALYARNADLDVTQFVRKQIAIRTSYASAVPAYEHAFELLASGAIPVDELVQLYPLDDAVKAFEDAAQQLVMKPMLSCAG